MSSGDPDEALSLTEPGHRHQQHWVAVNAGLGRLVAGLVPGDEDVRHAEQHQGVGRGVGLGLGGLKIF